MDPVSNADRLVRLLKQQLEQHSRAKRAHKPTEKQPARQTGLNQVRAVAGEVLQAGGEDRQLRRLLVEQLLSEQFGTGLVNEPRFQQIVDQVAELMSADIGVSALLTDVTTELRRSDA